MDILSSIYPFDISYLSSFVDKNECYINPFNVTVKKGEKIKISARHLRVKSSFFLSRWNPDNSIEKIDLSRFTKPLDSDTLLLDSANLPVQ